MIMKKRKPRRSGFLNRGRYARVGGHASFSKFSLYGKPSKRISMMKKVGAPNQTITNNVLRISPDEGYQIPGQWAFQNFQNLNDILSRTPGGVKQAVLESTTSDIYMTNSSIANAYLAIYDIVRKRDAVNSDGSTQSPAQAWLQGVSDQNSGDNTTYNQIGCLPTDSRLFNDYFKILRKTNIQLNQGCTHKHSVYLRANKLVDYELVTRCAADLAGYAVYTMVVVVGQPGAAPQEGGAPVITTTRVAIDCVQTVRQKYSWVSDNSIATYYTDNLSSIVSPDIVNIGSGTIGTDDIIQ